MNLVRTVLIFFSFYSTVLGQGYFYQFENSFKGHSSFSRSDSNKILLNQLWDASVEEKNVKVEMPVLFDFNDVVKLETFFKIPRDKKTFTKELIGEGGWFQAMFYLNDILIKTYDFNQSKFSIFLPEQELLYDKENKLSIYISKHSKAFFDFPSSSSINLPERITGLLQTPFLQLSPPISIVDAIFNPSEKELDKMSFSIEVKKRSLAKINEGFVGNKFHKNDTIAIDFEIAYDSLSPVSYKKVASFPLSFVSEKKIKAHVKLDSSLIFWKERSSNKFYKLRLLLRHLTTNNILDQVSVSKAFRKKIKFEDFGYLRGIRMVQDIQLFKKRHQEKQVFETIKKVQELGINTILFDTDPLSSWLDACDSLGMNVLIQLPIEKLPSEILTDKRFFTQATDFTERLLSKIKNSPSVIGFYIAGSVDDSQETLENFLSPLYQLIKSKGDYIVMYSCQDTKNLKKTYDYCDVLAVEVQKNQTSVQHLNNIQSIKEMSSGMQTPVIIVGLGSLVELGNRNGYLDEKSLDHQKKILYEAIEFLEKEAEINNNSFKGYVINSLYDYKVVKSQIEFSQYNDDAKLSATGISKLNEGYRPASEAVRAAILNDQKLKDPLKGTKKTTKSFFFTVSSLLLTMIFLLLVSYRLKAKENYLKSLKRPLSLFFDISENRLLFDLNSVIFLVFLSLIIGSVVSSILFVLKDSVALSLALSHFLGTKANDFFVYQILNPLYGVLVFSFLMFIIWLFVIFLFKFLIFIFKIRTQSRFRQYFLVHIWSSSILTLLIPVPFFLERFNHPIVFSILMWLIFAFVIIIIIRFNKAIIALEIGHRAKLHAIFFLETCLFLGGSFYLLEKFYALSYFITYWFKF